MHNTTEGQLKLVIVYYHCIGPANEFCDLFQNQNATPEKAYQPK